MAVHYLSCKIGSRWYMASKSSKWTQIRGAASQEGSRRCTSRERLPWQICLLTDIAFALWAQVQPAWQWAAPFSMRESRSISMSAIRVWEVSGIRTTKAHRFISQRISFPRRPRRCRRFADFLFRIRRRPIPATATSGHISRALRREQASCGIFACHVVSRAHLPSPRDGVSNWRMATLRTTRRWCVPPARCGIRSPPKFRVRSQVKSATVSLIGRQTKSSISAF
jgi:hypothetical protein